MAKFKIKTKEGERVYQIPEKAIKIGRVPWNDLVLEDPQVSRKHCLVYHDEGTRLHVLQDLDSSNGTYVNGKRIDGPVNLIDGDTISVGKTELVFKDRN